MPRERDRFTGYLDKERAVIDHVGRLVELWGFSRQMGRVWAILFLSRPPLAATEVCDRLSISMGLANMTVNALISWGVVRKVWLQGERKNFYEAETRPWRMISHVLERREFLEVDSLVEALEDACGKTGRASPRRERLESLLELARQGRRILEDILHLSLVRTSALRKLSIQLAAGYLQRQVRKAVLDPRRGSRSSAEVRSIEVDPWTPEEAAVVDQMGQVIELSGFGKNMGRIWCALYLAGRPRPAEEIRRVLSLSAGLVNTTTNALIRWGVLHRVRVPGERKSYFAAETDPWRMISRVLRQREHARIRDAIEVCEEALADGSRRAKDPDLAFRAKRIASLLDFFRLGERLLASVLDLGQVDIQPLQEFTLKR